MCNKMYYFIILSMISFVNCDIANSMIVGGKDAQITEFPHAAFLRASCHIERQPGWICGSSIINEKIVLTAAHCVYRCSGHNTMTISVGHSNKYKGIESTGLGVFVHEDYVETMPGFDIALIKLKTSLKFSSSVKRVILMKNQPRIKQALVTGWGYIQEYPKKSTLTLKYLDQYLWTAAKCRKNYKVPKGVLCASSRKVNPVTTWGDSGSALVVRGYIQIGIVSYKMPAISRSLVIYTDTGYFYNWIVRNAKKLYCASD